jgi:sRNA-binding protein
MLSGLEYANMTISIKNETKRGFQEASSQFAVLRTKWPLAFPDKGHLVRPLATGSTALVAAELGWSPGYARAVLMVWKLRETYCRAVLRYAQRINLDGSASAEEVDDKARKDATEQLDTIAARKLKKARIATEKKAGTEAPEPAPAAVFDEKPEAPAPIEPPQPRKLLVTGSAAMEAALKRRLASGAITTEVLKTVPVRARSNA